MANTQSAKKALRSSARKYEQNTFWKRRIKTARKNLAASLEAKNKDTGALKEMLSVFFSVLDRAAKNNVIHKNRASRLKSKYALKL